MEAVQLQLKNVCSVRMYVTFAFLACMYYAAILNHDTVYTSGFFPPKYNVASPCWLGHTFTLQTWFCLVQNSTLSLTSAPCTVLPQGNSSLAGGAISHELFLDPVERITPWSHKYKLSYKQLVLISETGFLMGYMEIRRAAVSSEEEFAVDWRSFEDGRKMQIECFQ